ncbi:MAG: vWA domain-containing protein [Candidatus Hodarchaeales archaeon]
MKKKDCINFLLLFIFLFSVVNLNLVQNINWNSTVSASTKINLISPSQDLIVHVEKNSSAIGPYSNLEFNVHLGNNISNSLYNITASLDYPEDIVITPVSNPIYSVPSIEPESSTEFSFIVEYVGNIETRAVDVILMIDGSGSMGDEIESVKRELINLTSLLSAQIPQLRMGAIVYGWKEYSEYPISSKNNYVEFTSNFDLIHNFINSLYASGGYEPWGDALYLANTWDWRSEASKLIILVGDEDCDPGAIIGREMLETDPNGTYNGTDLLNIVSELKDKEVVINTVVCKGAGITTINQFHWIAEYTEGTSVYLPDLENQGINLPMIIQEWTLEMGHELYKEITINVTWQDLENNFYSNSVVESFWLDFTPPSIIISRIITPTEPGLFSVEFLADVRDISEISYVTLYHNAFGSWEFIYLSRIENTSLYKTELTNIEKGVNLTFFIESSDVLKNSIQTQIMWFTVEPKIDLLGELITVWAEKEDNFFSHFKPSKTDDYFLILKGPLEIDSIEVKLFDLASNSSQDPILTKYINISLSSARKFFQFEFQQYKNYSIQLSIPANSNNYSFSYTWINFQDPDENNQYTGVMTDVIRVHGVKWTANNRTYLFFKFNQSSPLTLIGEVYTSNLEKVSSFNLLEATKIQTNDTYYVLVWAGLRTGDFTLINNITLPPQVYDPYYTAIYQTQNATSLPNLIYFVILIVSLVFFRKRRKGLRT